MRGTRKPTQSGADSGLHGRSEYWAGGSSCSGRTQQYKHKTGFEVGYWNEKNSTNHRSLKSGQISQYLKTTLMNRLTHLCRPFPSVSGILRTKSLAFTAHLNVATDKFLAQHVSKLIFPSTVEYQRRRCPRGDTPSVPTPSWCNTGHVGTVGRGNVLEAIIILGGLTIPSLHMAGTADKYAHGSHDVPRSKRKGTDSSTSQLQLEDLTLANITQSTRAYEPIVRVPPGPWKALCK